MIYELAEKVGILKQYKCFLTNSDHVGSKDALKAILKSFGFNVESDDEISKEIENLEYKDLNVLVPSVIALRTLHLPLRLRLSIKEADLCEKGEFRVDFESGNVFKGEFNPFNLKTVEEKICKNQKFIIKEIILNIDAEWGYHDLSVNVGKINGNSRLIIAPEQGYKPDNLKHWGLPIQLYSIKSKKNWGIGDFSDLKEVIKNSALLGASLVGLNPMTALKPHEPENASPYSVSSRLYLNTIYIDPDNIKESQKCKEYQEYVSNKEFKAKLKQARQSENVDYTLVSDLKMGALKIIYKFMMNEKGESYDAFYKFYEQEGETLKKLALYQAICAEFGFIKEEYKDSNSLKVKQYFETNKFEVDFYAWLQWIAVFQFKEAGLQCFENHMRIGLYQDLAVGVSHDSAEAWANPEMFLKGVSIGSPPDDFCDDGQNWGLAPMNPLYMKEDKYQYFIKIIRQSMSESGALRIDHAMGLNRLFYIPDGLDGTYVNYPFDDLLTIVVLESHRNQCVVIGEDLGNMPEGFSEAMNRSGILSMVVGRWIMGYSELPKVAFMDRYMSLLAFSNHDMPTLPAYWLGKDIELLKHHNFIKDEIAYNKALIAREDEKRRLIFNLSRNGYFFNDGSKLPLNLVYAMYDYLSASPNYLFLPQLEDVLGQIQQINLPGTDKEHENWRYKLSLNVEDWLCDERVLKLAMIMKDKYSN